MAKYLPGICAATFASLLQLTHVIQSQGPHTPHCCDSAKHSVCSKLKICFQELSRRFFFFFNLSIFNLQLADAEATEPVDREGWLYTVS